MLKNSHNEVSGVFRSALKNFLIKHLGTLLFLLSLIAGLLSFSKFGISWDEPYQRRIGLVNFNHAFKGDDEIQNFPGNDHGASFELFLVITEKILGLLDTRDIYLMRHLVSHIVFLLCALSAFFLIDFLFQNKLLAAIGFLMLVLNPQLHAHSFYNTKDVPFLSLLMISFYLAAVAFKTKKIYDFVLLGVCCGLYLSLRIMGILPFACILLFLGIDFVLALLRKEKVFRIGAVIVVFISTTLSVLYISWPYLYTAPIPKLIGVFAQMSKYQWGGNVLFFGNMINATRLPWYYAIGWFLVSNPLSYLLLGFTGILFFCWRFLKSPLAFVSHPEQRNFLGYLICFTFPLVSVVFLHSILYDGWRHLFFIYPAFVMLAIFAIHHLLQTRLKWLTLFVAFSGFISSAVFMAIYIPHSHVFFNSIVRYRESEYLRKHFDLDYWGVSAKQGLEYLLEQDQSPQIDVCAASMAIELNLEILPPEQRARINFCEYNEAKYFITNYRWHPGDYEHPPSNIIFRVKVLKSTIMSVIKLK